MDRIILCRERPLEPCRIAFRHEPPRGGRAAVQVRELARGQPSQLLRPAFAWSVASRRDSFNNSKLHLMECAFAFSNTQAMVFWASCWICRR